MGPPGIDMSSVISAWRPLPMRIVGRKLPGLHFGDHDAVHVGIQRRTQVVDLMPGDANLDVFSFTIDATVADGAAPDFRGPFVHGRRGERFLYLCWGQVAAGGDFEMFRRAKLHLSVLGADEVANALATGAVLEATLDLTDARGGPLCASVRPPKIAWRVDSTGATTVSGV